MSFWIVLYQYFWHHITHSCSYQLQPACWSSQIEKRIHLLQWITVVACDADPVCILHGFKQTWEL